jgi:hypothetical protein
MCTERKLTCLSCKAVYTTLLPCASSSTSCLKSKSVSGTTSWCANCDHSTPSLLGKYNPSLLPPTSHTPVLAYGTTFNSFPFSSSATTITCCCSGGGKEKVKEKDKDKEDSGKTWAEWRVKQADKIFTKTVSKVMSELINRFVMALVALLFSCDVRVC